MSIDIDRQSQSDQSTNPDILNIPVSCVDAEATRVKTDRTLYRRVKMAKPVDEYYAVSQEEPEEAEQKKKDYEKFLQDSKELYGFLNHENPLYGKLRGVLDRVLVAAHIEPESVKLDCVFDSTANALVVPSSNHIFLNIGTLFKVAEDDSISLDVIAGILAHEIVHIKYKNKSSSHVGKLDKRMKQYTLRREEERMADIEAVEILNRAGFNPNAITTLFESFSEEKRKEDDYDFVMSGVQGIMYDPHEGDQRRVDYLKEHIGSHLFKNRDKDHETITKAAIDLQNEDYGFLYLLHSGMPHKAIEAIKQPWQLAYVCNFLKKANAFDEFEPQISSLKSIVLTPALSDFSPSEQELIWDILIWEEDYNMEEASKIRENTGINLKKVAVFLPKLFPDSKMKYHHPLDPSLNVDDSDFYSPLEKVMTMIMQSDGVNISTAFLKEWAKEKPEWIINFIDVFVQSLRKRDFKQLTLLKKEEAIAVLLRSIQMSNITLDNDQKMAVFRIFDEDNRRTTYDLVSSDEDDSVEAFCRRHLVNEKPERNQHAYLQGKYEFLKFLKIAKTEVTGHERFITYNPRDSYELLPMTSGIDIHRRSILLGINGHFSNLAPELKDYKKKIEYESVNKVQHTIRLNPKPFPWEIGENKEGAKKKEVDPMFSEFGDQLESFRVTPYQFWSAVMTDMATDDYVAIAEFRNILSSDIDAYMLANIICYQLNSKSRGACRKHLSRLSKNNPKAKQVKDLVDLALVRKKDLKALPPIFERNYLFLKKVQRSKKKLKAYQEAKEYFIQEDKSAIHKRLDEEFASGELHQKIISMMMSEDAGTVYQQALLGPANHAMDEAAFLAWKELEQTSAYTSLDLSGKIMFIKSFFPDISFRKEELIAELPAATTEEMQLILTHLSLPIFRYRVGDKIWKLQLDELSGASLDEKMQLLLEGFPEASYYRDEIIEKILLDHACSYEECEKYRALLFAGNTVKCTDDEQLSQLFVFRLMSQLVYFSPKEAKSTAFEKLLESAEKDSVFKKYFTQTEKTELLKAFFTGPQSITKDPRFIALLESMFLSKIFSPDIVDKLDLLAELKIKIQKSMEDKDKSEESFAKDIGKDHANQTIDVDEYSYEQDWYKDELAAIAEELTRVQKLTLEEMMLSETDKSGYEERIIYLNHFHKLLKESIPQAVYDQFPTAQKLFFAIVDTLPQDRQAHVISQFLIKTLDGNEKNFSDLVISFLEFMGPVWIKTGQYLASLGYLDREMQIKLLKLTSRVDPISVFDIWHVLWEEYGDDFDFIETLGPLLGVASIRQVHKVRLKNGEERIIKIKRPDAIHTIADGLISLRKFVAATRRDSSLLKGIVLPDDLVSELTKAIDNEVLSSGDQEEQNQFHEKYEGTNISGKRLYIPTVDQKNSTPIITLETEAPGLPLGEDIDGIPEATKKGLLKFFLQLIFEKGKYHADPHPGNILESSDSISLVDFGMVATLDPENKYLFFDILRKVLSEQQKALNVFLVGHLHNGGSLEGLDLGVINQELDFLFKTSLNNGDTFQDTALRLINTLENLKISLPSEIKIIIKTISQMGYLIEGQESLLKEWFATEIVKNAMTAQSEAFSELHEQVRQFIAENTEVVDQGLIKIAEGSLVRQTSHPENVWETTRHIELDPSTISNYLMLDLGTMKVGILPGRRNYEVFRGGRWVSIEELVFGK